jgi:hypothetical protein
MRIDDPETRRIKKEKRQRIVKDFREKTNRKMKPRPRGDNQMNLGTLIKALTREREVLTVRIDAGDSRYDDKYPGVPHGYAGYQGDLAFTATTTPVTVIEFLALCKSIVMKPSMGPDPTFSRRIQDPAWISDIGVASKMGIVDVVPRNGEIILVVASIPDYKE